MERIKELARQLAERFGTADPFALCAALDITVLPVGLPPGVRGFYGCVHGARILYLNGALEENERRTVCAHELGHHFLHRGLNRLFMDRNTCMVANKYENEAHRFAVDLLYDDADLRECAEWSDEQVARWMGVPLPLARYRRSTVPPLPGDKNPF